MFTILEFALTNAAWAMLLACCVVLLTFIIRNAHLAHLLWLVVLVKLVTPPLISIPLSLNFIERSVFQSGQKSPTASHVPNTPSTRSSEHSSPLTATSRFPERKSTQPPNPSLAETQNIANQSSTTTSSKNSPLVAAPQHEEVKLPNGPLHSDGSGLYGMLLEHIASIPWQAWTIGVWICGTLGWLLVALHRIAQFHGLLCKAEPASTRETQLLAQAAAKMKFTAQVSMCIVNAHVSPMVWPSVCRPKIVLPRGLVARLDDDKLRTIIAHELAHIIRHDHWVRWLEVVCTALYWWHPAVYLARRSLRINEEVCCDALVVESFPTARQPYSECLLDIVDFVTRCTNAVPTLVSGMAGGNNLKRRVQMLLQNRLPSKLSPIAKGMVVILAICALSFSPRLVWALGQESFGPAGEHISRSNDWPKGVDKLLRHPSRVYWNWVNGNEHSYYDGDIKTVNELLGLFAQIDLPVHQVVVRPGRPSARSFHGKLTPYAVEFEIPGGIYLHHIREYATTGLYSAMPRLIIHVDDALAKQLGELKVPDNTSLQELPYQVKDALAQINAHDRSLRGRAIAVLGESGDSSTVVVKALKHLAASGSDEYIRNAAQRAIAQLERANDPAEQALRQQVAEYLKNHPLRRRIPKPQELLETLRKIDDQYAQGFTAKGTMIEPTPSDPGRLVAWTVTMGNDRLVFQRRTVEDDDHPPTAGLREYTIYVGPDRMAMIQSTRLWVDGELIDSQPHTSFEPVGSTYDLLLGRALWPLGRSYTRRIDRITQVAEEADGTLSVVAESDEGSLKMRWEMRVDPSAGYLVRFAKAFRRDQPDPMYIVDNAGALFAADRSTAHTARWTEGISAHPVSISVTSVSAKTDTELIRKTEEGL